MDTAVEDFIANGVTDMRFGPIISPAEEGTTNGVAFTFLARLVRSTGLGTQETLCLGDIACNGSF